MDRLDVARRNRLSLLILLAGPACSAAAAARALIAGSVSDDFGVGASRGAASIVEAGQIDLALIRSASQVLKIAFGGGSASAAISS